MMRWSTPLLLLPVLGFASPARAACDDLVRRAEKARGRALVDAFNRLAACDRAEADRSFTRLMQNAGDAETLVALSLAAIDQEVWKPVWTMVGKISDYSARDEVAGAIGQACVEHPDVVRFLQGAYHALRDIDFAQWDDALVQCPSPDLEQWMAATVSDPPTTQYDDKWDALAKAWVQRKGPEGLDALLKALEVAGTRGGPFEVILEHTIAAVTPEFSIELPPEQRDLLADRWSEVARRLPPERARVIADRLAQLGADDRAAALLPVIYPDRQQDDGSFHYAAIAAEAGTCDGDKRVVLHVATLVSDGSRYDVLPLAESALRDARPRLKRCDPEEGPWPVWVSPEPLGGPRTLDAYLDEVRASWEEKGYAVKVRKERPITGS